MGLIQWLLKRFDHRKTEHAAERRIRNTAGETEVAQFVVPIVKYDVNTGEFKNFDEWDDPQTFNDAVTFNGLTTHNDGLCVPLGENLVFGLCAGDDYMTQPRDDEIEVYCNGLLCARFHHNGTINRLELENQLILKEGQRFVFDTDEDSYLRTDADDDLRITVGNTETFRVWKSGANTGCDVTGKLSATTDIEATDDVIVGDDLLMGLTQRVVMDDDLDTYMLSSVDDQYDFITGGLTRYLFNNYGTTAFKRVQLNGCWLQLGEISDPANTAGYGQLYCKDNAGTTELWFQDDAGTKTQLA